MNVDEFERHILTAAAQWSFLRTVDTVDKTDYAVKLRLHVDVECFIQIYANVHKGIFSYALVLNRSRIYGRDNEGGTRHRHPHGQPDNHDVSPEGRTEVTLAQFLAEAQKVLKDEGLL